MSNISDNARLEAILGYINDIETIVSRHGELQSALSDIEGQYALLMCIQQIGELVNKLENQKYTEIIPVKDIVGFRNIIVHNYDGINLHIVEQIISVNIPQLRETVHTLFSS